MPILYNELDRSFHLQTNKTSYVMQVANDGYLAHIYWGKKVREARIPTTLRYRDRGFSPNPNKVDRAFSLDTLPQEFPAYGNTDFRNPAIQLVCADGSRITDFRYTGHSISEGKPKLDGLPATYVEDNNEAETLTITLTDNTIDVDVHLQYTIYSHLDVLTRSVKIVNKGSEAVTISKIASMNVDIRDTNFEMVNLPGAHVRERDIERLPIRRGTQSVSSRRGSSSHHQNPFIALVRPETTEEAGEAYGFSFVYSGNFDATVEVDQTMMTRVNMGINSFDFSWLLEHGEAFQAPEVVMVYSATGIGDMSRTYHTLYRERLCRGNHRDKERPILINNWEATYFDFNEQSILEIAEKAKQTGIELFVLDDGWFGKRDDDTSSLGDWMVGTNKLQRGLASLADEVNKKEMQFGLWFEPEMVSPDSELYRTHPDWCIHVPNRRRSESRNQLVLDFSREDVCKEITKRIAAILESAPINYVKWDMNRNITETGSALLPKHRQQEMMHRYMLGLYAVMEELTTKFPNVLFESCSGGGGRFDPGMLYYMPQTWTSDNTDAISRLRIQYGTSLVYPVSSMGAHVSVVPNHQVGRITPLKTRGDVAMDGNLGYELDVTKLSENELDVISQQVRLYKSIRQTIQFGDLYRLVNPFEEQNYSSIHVNKDKTEAVFIYVHVLAEANGPFHSVKLAGLDPDKEYQIIETSEVYGGDELMHMGLNVPYPEEDFTSILWRLKEHV